jgi:predicted transcriptional regulator
MFEEREDEAIRAGWRQMVRVLSTKGPTPVPELMAESGLGFAAFTRALESARSNDLVKLESHGSQERAALTDIGEKIANLSY